ncbi:Hypothetical Protein CGB_D5630W [Cryptococcus gattii WM276]|uniref:BRCT domain-containing protein n=1 Tax=Cryptococcus gattii serotype B (strain WM276 / ATCC MYA-4071) TaxID=367775 RepID=E6R478_CRYGW|nr:Hypothetical Protein CGB_D5630W [Cryptococcus gattii WM276]ADV21866.1 Hypothetical Protein CGB_D5630W [Cryptococcus gattii WM276]
MTATMDCPLRCKHIIDLPDRAYFTQRTPSYISAAFERNSHNLASSTPLSRGQCYIFAESLLDPEVVALQSQGAVVYRADWVAQCLAKGYTVPLQEWVFDFIAGPKGKSSSFPKQHPCIVRKYPLISTSSTLVDVQSPRAPDTPTPITGLLETLEVNLSYIPPHRQPKKLPIQSDLPTNTPSVLDQRTGQVDTRNEALILKYLNSVDDRTSDSNVFFQDRHYRSTTMKRRGHQEVSKHNQSSTIDTLKMPNLCATHSNPRRRFRATRNVTENAIQSDKRPLNEHQKVEAAETWNVGMKRKTVPAFMFDDTLSELLKQSKKRRVLKT